MSKLILLTFLVLMLSTSAFAQGKGRGGGVGGGRGSGGGPPTGTGARYGPGFGQRIESFRWSFRRRLEQRIIEVKRSL